MLGQRRCYQSVWSIKVDEKKVIIFYFFKIDNVDAKLHSEYNIIHSCYMTDSKI